MTAFTYRAGVLHAEAVSLEDVAAAVETPFYCYATGAIETAYTNFTGALAGLPATVCYALKANGNLAVVRTLARLGAGADVVSGGELQIALAAGVPARKIVFAGVGKTAAEMAAALDAGILQFNVESLPELELLAQVARDKGARAPIALRVNPDVDARTHQHISTGKAENKFGIDLAQVPAVLARAAALPSLSVEGLAVHIGSQLTEAAPYRAAFSRLIDLYREQRAAGIPLRRLDFGGGLGITYRDETPPDLAAYAGLVRELTAGLEAELVFEPGRCLVGNAGVLVTRVLYVKDGTARRFVIVDAGMNDLIRPQLYDAWHEIVPVREAPANAARAPVDVVGPVCESTDTFARQRPLPPVASGDLLAFCSAGAYGAVMASSYNCRPPAPEVLVRAGDFAVVRPRPEVTEMIARDHLPPWLETAKGAQPRRAGGRGGS
ncbi:MAG TPA: diaminopimelate decarboxylase [Kiloniellales bacterium]|jgi:diaminopimelate decarboxylase